MTDVFIASDYATAYPRKLQKPSTVSERVRKTAETFILDSGIGEDVTNAEVLDLAEQFNADYVIAKDYLHDQKRTTESVKEFMDRYVEHDCTATPMVPLQPPYDLHYASLKGYDHYVLGGMSVDTVTNKDRVRWIHDFRNVAPDVYAHALGVGGGAAFSRQIAGTGLIDSLDCSTPEQAAMYGSVLDHDLRQHEVRIKNGADVAKRNIPLATFNSYQVQDFWDQQRDTKQTSTTDFI